MNTPEEKEKAVTFLKAHQVGDNLQLLLNDLYRAKPTDVYGYMSDVLETYAGQPTINVIKGYKVKSVYDGYLLQISVTCNVRNHTEELCSVVVGNEKSEEVNLDILKEINDSLVGSLPFKQHVIDEKLCDLGLSDTVTLCVSLCVFHSGLALLHHSRIDRLYALLVQEESKVTSPLPIVTMVTCGKSCPGKNNIVSVGAVPAPGQSYQKGMDVMEQIYYKVEELLRKKYATALPNAAPNGGFYYTCDKLEQMLELVKEAGMELELEAGTDYHLVVNCGAEQFHTEVAPNQGSAKKGQAQSNSRHRYDWVEGQVKPTEDVCDMLEGLMDIEPIVAIIDPLCYEDVEGYQRLVGTLGPKCHIMSSKPVECTGVSRVMGFEKTVSKTLATLKKSADCPITVLAGANHEEGDTLIADLAMTGNCKMIYFGGLRGLRAKLYSRLSQLIEIETGKGSVSPALSTFEFVPAPPAQEAES